MRKVSVFLILLVFTLTASLFSDATQIGGTANNFLKILAPAKPAALGEAYTAIGDDLNSIYYNPAGLGRSMLGEFNFTHVEWFQSVRDENVGLLLPFSFGNLGFSINYLTVSKMDKTIVSGAPGGYDVVGSLEPSSFAGVVSFAKEFSENFFIGASAKVLNYSIDPSAANGSAISFMLDLGVVYDISFIKGLSVGLVAKNIGPGTTYIKEAFLQPMTFRGGLGYSGRYFCVEADAEYVNDNDLNYFVGGGVTIMDVISLRGGYKGGTIKQLTAGGGLSLGSFSLDYAYVPYTTDDLGTTHRITASYRFGSPEVKLAAKPRVFSPNNDRIYDFVFFIPEVVAKNKVKNASMAIYDAYKKPVRIFGVKAFNRLFWNGYDTMGMPSPDGNYYAALMVDYGNGVKSTSNFAPFALDNTPPNVFGDASPKSGKPGSVQTVSVPVTFTENASDLHGIGAWKIIITGPDGKPFKTFSGKGEPYPVQWDGKDDLGMMETKSSSIYTYTFYAMDTVGNWGRSQSVQTKVILREIVINLAADTLFDIGKADVKISVYKDLQKIADMIKSNGSTKIIVEGHTDSQPLRRSKNYADNMALLAGKGRSCCKVLCRAFRHGYKDIYPGWQG